MKTNFTLSLDKTKKYLLGLSGGADSVCLFHLLRENGIPFSAAHVNHGIRGAEADGDEEFCRSLAKKFGIEFFFLRADVPALAKARGESLEEAARNVRYDFFEKLMREHDIPVLLTAHNANDNAETLLLALTRGASPSGACGIPRERELEFGRVIRPMLSVPKADIIEFCKENSFEFVTDSTNSDVSYARNRIRANVIPELSGINPRVLEAMSRFTEAQREDNEFLEALAHEFISREGMSREKLALIARPVASRVLCICAHDAGAAPEANHIDRMLDAIKNGGKLSLPGGIIFDCSSETAVFYSECRIPKNERQIYPVYDPLELKIGENRVGEGILTLVCGELTNDSAQVYNLSTSAHINLDTIKGQLYARPRKEGDRILIGGSHKSLKKLISEKLSALPLDIRRALPVVTIGEEIVYVPGLPVCDTCRAEKNARVLTLQYCI